MGPLVGPQARRPGGAAGECPVKSGTLIARSAGGPEPESGGGDVQGRGT